jgi:hypothetical protein
MSMKRRDYVEIANRMYHDAYNQALSLAEINPCVYEQARDTATVQAVTRKADIEKALAELAVDSAIESAKAAARMDAYINVYAAVMVEAGK